jgi:hypothetical protein
MEHYGKVVKAGLVVDNPLGEYRIFNITRARYEPLQRMLWMQKFEEQLR